MAGNLKIVVQQERKHQGDIKKPFKEQGWLRIEQINTDYKRRIESFRLSFLRCVIRDVSPLILALIKINVPLILTSYWSLLPLL